MEKNLDYMIKYYEEKYRNSENNFDKEKYAEEIVKLLDIKIYIKEEK